VIHFKFWGSGDILGADEVKHFDYGVQIDRNEHYHVHDKIPQYRGAFKVM